MQNRIPNSKDLTLAEIRVAYEALQELFPKSKDLTITMAIINKSNAQIHIQIKDPENEPLFHSVGQTILQLLEHRFNKSDATNLVVCRGIGREMAD